VGNKSSGLFLEFIKVMRIGRRRGGHSVCEILLMTSAGGLPVGMRWEGDESRNGIGPEMTP
jgi:hypothetical protein